MNQIINMILRIVMRKVVSKGIDAGFDRASRMRKSDGKSQEMRDPQQQQQSKAPVQKGHEAQMRQAKQAMRSLRRVGRF
ncbi:hypothetical protein ABMC89_05020 [Sulfitobacter sp. HNIBRBA3233]|uniref:hypothetical protein n=1 Tax=Sulfitobacter marinivivus TaxID=3158558 RepID=UPI0032DE97B7